MKQNSNRFASYGLALTAGTIGATLAASSLAYNLEGVLPRIDAEPGSFSHYVQMLMEGGATIGLNLVALSGFTFASIAWTSGQRIKAPLVALVAVLAMLWSGVTQLGVIADKSLTVSTGKKTSKSNYADAVAEHKRLLTQLPAFALFVPDARNDLSTAIAALKSKRYGKRTAWETTNRCQGDITAKASIALCNAYRKAEKALAVAMQRSTIEAKMAELNKVIVKGPPATVDAGPEMIAEASNGLVTVQGVQKLKAAVRSFGIDLAASLFLALAFGIRPAKPIKAPAVSKAKTKAVIERIKSSAQTDHNDDMRVLGHLDAITLDGSFKAGHRSIAKACGISHGNVTHILKRLADKGLIEYKPTTKGTIGKVIKVAAHV